MNGYQLVLRHPAASKILLRCFSLSAAAGSYIRNSVSVRSGSCHRQRVRSCLSCFSQPQPVSVSQSSVTWWTCFLCLCLFSCRNQNQFLSQTDPDPIFPISLSKSVVLLSVLNLFCLMSPGWMFHTLQCLCGVRAWCWLKVITVGRGRKERDSLVF